MESPPPKKFVDRTAIDDLKSQLQGEVVLPSGEDFKRYTTIFNAMVTSDASVLVRPLNAEDVSRVVKFCKHHKLSLSVKAGGYGTHGWAVAGDVVVDLTLINAVSLSLATPNHTPPSFNIPSSPPPPTKSSSHSSAHSSSSANKRSRNDAFGSNGSASAATSISAGSASGSGSGSGSSDGSRAGKRANNVSDETGWGSSRHKTETVLERGSESSGEDGRDSPVAIPETLHNATVPTSTSLQSFLPSTTWVNPAFDASLPSFRPTYRIPPPPPVSVSPDAPGHADPLLSYSPSSALVSPLFSGAQLYDPGARSHSGSSSGSSSSRRHRSRGSHPSNDPPAAVAYATFGAGCQHKEVDACTSSSSLGSYHVPFAAFPVGTGVMLSGGFGFLSRQYGLSMDNLVEVEMVTADGEIKIVNEQSDPDLWWALRGFGTTLGICTRYIARAYPVSVVYSGNIIYPFNRVTAPSLFQHFRDTVADAPKQLYANMILTAGPEGGGSRRDMEGMVEGKGKGAGGSGGGAVVVIQLCWNGPREEGSEWVRAMCAWEGETLLFKDVDERSFMQQQDSIANVLRGGAGRKWFIKSDVLNSLTDEIIHDTVRMFRDVPDGCSWLFELAGGAIEDAATSTCLPLASRKARFNLLALHQWPLDESFVGDERCVKTAADWIANVIAPGSPGGPLPCFIDQNSPVAGVAKTFGPENWEKLKQIKRQWDPRNMFRFSIGGGLGDEVCSEVTEKGKDKAMS